MATYTLANQSLSLTVASHGAELRSLKDAATGREYLWQADPAFWGRTAPVLFPVVGNYRNKTSYYNGTAYTLGQHGFARDAEFSLVSQTETELWFSLEDSAQTLAVYPFHFTLSIGYRLRGTTVTVLWRVHNKESVPMYFSIGAHPAFNCTLGSDTLLFDTTAHLTCGILTASGTLSSRTKQIPLHQTALPLTAGLFAEDALVIENGQTHRVALATHSGEKIIELSFDAPVVGIWSPAGKNAPFVCIEPWYGRADAEDFNQQLTERAWGNTLAAGQDFEKSYTITAFPA